MTKEPWLQLSDYSNKYKVSVSTLRRRIKADEIQFQFEDGKYWLPDRPIEKYVRNRSAAPVAPKEEISPINEGPEFPVNSQMDEVDFNTSDFVTRDELLEVTSSMLQELKSAYVVVLQEKEAQIMEAKKEIADLKTLCHTLESENEKLKAENAPALNGWFIDEDSEVEL